MPKPRSRRQPHRDGRRGGRQTRQDPAASRPPTFESLTATFIRSGRRIAKATDPLEAEIFGSVVISLLETDPGHPAERRLALVDRLLDELKRRRDVGSLPVALALTAVLPEPMAEHARAAAAALVASGSTVPPWSLAVGRARFVEAWAATDEFGDQDLIVASFKHPGQEPHTIQLTADHNFNGLFRQAEVSAKVDLEMIKRVWADISNMPLEPISALELSGRWADGTTWYRRYLDPPVYDDVPPVMAFLESRSAALPPPPPEPEEFEFAELSQAERLDLVERFLVSAPGHAIRRDVTTGMVLDSLIDFRDNHGEGDLLRWSPIVVEIALFDWLPRKAILGDEEIAALPDILRAFVRFAAAEKGLADEDLAETLAAIDEFIPEFRERASDPDAFGMGKRLALQMQADGIDPTDEAAVSAWMEAFNERSIEERDEILGPLPEIS